MCNEQRTRLGVGGDQHSTEAAEHVSSRRRRRRSAAARSKAQLGRRVAHLRPRRDRAARCRGRRRRRNRPQHLVEPASIQVRVEVAQARRQAAPHLAVGGWMVAPRQPPAAVAQAEQRVELLHQLERQPPTPHRSDRDRVARRGVAADLEDRKRDVEPAADVDEPVVAAGETLVARRPQLLDQPVLEHECPELGARGPIVDDGGVGRPARRGRRGREVRPGTAADRDRLADVEDTAVVVAEQVYAGITGQLAEIRAGAGRAGSAVGNWPWLAARCARRRDGRRGGEQRRAPRPPWSRARTGAGTARTRPAPHVSASASARWAWRTSIPSASASAVEPPLALQRQHRPGQRRRAEHRRVGPVQPDALERLAQHPAVERRRCARPSRGPASSSASDGQHRRRARARRRPSPG